jgi:nitric oxide reductase subunit B
MQSGSMQTLRWMRVPGDIVFSIGAAAFAWFVLGLLTGHSYDKTRPIGLGSASRDAHREREEALAAR